LHLYFLRDVCFPYSTGEAWKMWNKKVCPYAVARNDNC
jgi:hypothetical protein